MDIKPSSKNLEPPVFLSISADSTKKDNLKFGLIIGSTEMTCQVKS